MSLGDEFPDGTRETLGSVDGRGCVPGTCLG